MRVLNLMKTSVGGVWALRQMEELVRLGLEMHVTLPEPCALYERYRRSGIRVHLMQTDFSLKVPWRLPARVFALRRLVETLKPDIVHSHFVGTTLTMRLALRSKKQLPRIFQVPGPLHLEHRFIRMAEIKSAQSCDTWIATCSASRRRYVQAGVAPQRVMMSYYGTETRMLLGRKMQGRLRRELGLAQHVPIVGMVAYMYKPRPFLGQKRGLKGHEDLIDAAAIALKDVPDLRVVFIGGAWNGAERYESSVRRYAREKIPGRFFFLGNRNDVPELYGDFDVAVHPSHSENLGGAAESLLLGIPTIATDVGGFPDLVKPGKTGTLVPPKDPAKLAAAIVHTWRHREHALAMAANGAARVAATCDIAVTASNILSIYSHMLSSRPPERPIE